MGMMMAAGAAVSGTGASTFRMPSMESVDTILVVSISTGSLETTGSGVYSVSANKMPVFSNSETDVHNI